MLLTRREGRKCLSACVISERECCKINSALVLTMFTPSPFSSPPFIITKTHLPLTKFVPHFYSSRNLISVSCLFDCLCCGNGFLREMQETFAEYTARTAFERPLLSGVAYAQRVAYSERERFEKQHGWTIKTMKREASPIRDEYAPVIFSQETVSYIESLDMMSGEVNSWFCDIQLFGILFIGMLTYG